MTKLGHHKLKYKLDLANEMSFLKRIKSKEGKKNHFYL